MRAAAATRTVGAVQVHLLFFPGLFASAFCAENKQKKKKKRLRQRRG